MSSSDLLPMLTIRQSDMHSTNQCSWLHWLVASVATLSQTERVRKQHYLRLTSTPARLRIHGSAIWI